MAEVDLTKKKTSIFMSCCQCRFLEFFLIKSWNGNKNPAQFRLWDGYEYIMFFYL